ncbi:zinc metalloproteinase nas-13-like isoform X1 [Haliotis cracherodii]|uniref:zinc metalloproteinase nas-13-like isoform X1 n=1 Tax=Haliotis cracherodii TaxID=6455 RepID=UPI0039E94524
MYSDCKEGLKMKIVAILLVFLSYRVCDAAPADNDGKTIDEIIMESAVSHEMFDLIHDMGDGEMMVMVELDILLTLKELAKYGNKRSRVRRKATSSDRQLWENCNVYYEIEDADFSDADRVVIAEALAEWQNYTCLKFRRSSTEPSRIRVRNGGGCYSRLGRTGGIQDLALAPNCRRKGIVVHEFGHAIGWFHEQARPDRDDFVTINFDQIPVNWRSQFGKVAQALVNDRGVEYDYDSIMHYSGNTFGPGTIVTRNPEDQSRLGQRFGLSFRDIKLANLMYNCAGTMGCEKKTCPGEGFQGKDCKCYCPGPVRTSPVVPCGNTTRPTTPTTPTTTSATSTTEGVPPGPDCMDVRSGCAELKANGLCKNDTARMSVFCRKTCDLCSTTPSGSCMDYDEGCPLFAANGYCERDGLGVFFRDECPLSCKVCTPVDECAAFLGQSSSPGHMSSFLATVVMVTVAIWGFR